MNLLKRIKEVAAKNGERIAICGSDVKLTYEQLDLYSDRLACWLNSNLSDSCKPVVVYGHKSAYMIVAFLACVKSKRAYVPQDISIPMQRVQDTVNKIEPEAVIELEGAYVNSGKEIHHIISMDDIKQITEDGEIIEELLQEVSPEDVFYMIFTSGSTGTPKGVQITRECLENFLEWSVTLGGNEEEKQGMNFLNQAPFSFDLSVMDLYTSLCCGGTLHTLTKETQADYKAMFEAMRAGDINIWVSTPSFADMCLSDEMFSKNLMPNLKIFLFCGETLKITTVKKLMKRFPETKILNTYGPTESTVAVTSVEINEELLFEIEREELTLPVGHDKPNTFIRIMDEAGNILPDGETGEIIIAGDSVSTGYYKLPEITKKSFFIMDIAGESYRAYRTKDSGFIKDGELYYVGRIDLQIKLHGYRIELEDIGSNLEKLPEIDSAVVIPCIKDNAVKSLTAFVTGANTIESAHEYSKYIKGKLKDYLPSYMIPKKIIHLDKMPMTNNGKADRKQLGGMI